MLDSVMPMTSAGRRIIQFIEHDRSLMLKIGEIDSVKIDRFTWKRKSGDGRYLNQYAVRIKGSLGKEHVVVSETCREDDGRCSLLSIE